VGASPVFSGTYGDPELIHHIPHYVTIYCMVSSHMVTC